MTTANEVRKDSKHLTVFPPTLGGFTQEEKDRLAMLVRKEIVEVERTRWRHEIIVTNNKLTPKLEDEEKQKEKESIINHHVRAVEMFTKELDNLETILKKLDD